MVGRKASERTTRAAGARAFDQRHRRSTTDRRAALPVARRRRERRRTDLCTRLAGLQPYTLGPLFRSAHVGRGQLSFNADYNEKHRASADVTHTRATTIVAIVVSLNAQFELDSRTVPFLFRRARSSHTIIPSSTLVGLSWLYTRTITHNIPLNECYGVHRSQRCVQIYLRRGLMIDILPVRASSGIMLIARVLRGAFCVRAAE